MSLDLALSVPKFSGKRAFAATPLLLAGVAAIFPSDKEEKLFSDRTWELLEKRLQERAKYVNKGEIPLVVANEDPVLRSLLRRSGRISVAAEDGAEIEEAERQEKEKELKVLYDGVPWEEGVGLYHELVGRLLEAEVAIVLYVLHHPGITRRQLHVLLLVLSAAPLVDRMIGGFYDTTFLAEGGRVAEIARKFDLEANFFLSVAVEVAMASAFSRLGGMKGLESRSLFFSILFGKLAGRIVYSAAAYSKWRHLPILKKRLRKKAEASLTEGTKEGIKIIRKLGFWSVKKLAKAIF